jgi:membrane-bound metal-dependent hydrolase YbcI (DUF457 family)
MYVEHAVWTLAVCVIAGMFYANYPRERNPVWIIWFAMLLPDSDFIAQTIWENVFPYKTTVLFVHGQFHNILGLAVSVMVVGWLVWRFTKITYRDAAICVAIGFVAHLLEDALVNGVTYHFYFPISNRGWYQGFILTPDENFVLVHTIVSSVNIAAIGFCLLILAILFRSNIQGYDWLEKFNPYPALKRMWITELKPELVVWSTN